MISNLTAYDIIYNALQICGVISYGESIEPAIAKTALQMLNSLRAEWSGRYINYKRYDEVFYPTSSTYHITLGSSNTVSGNILVRPALISEITVSFGTVNYQIPVKTYEEYRQLTITNVLSIPSAGYIDNEYPLLNVFFYPGIAPGYSVRIMGLAYLPEYENISDSYIDPPELFQCLIYALALKLAPMFGTDANSMGSIFPMLQSALKGIKTSNFKVGMKRAKNDMIGANGGFNFLAGV